MPITINGTGTVAGISAGGLPSGTVTSDTLASSAVYLTAPAGAVCFVAQNTAPTGWLKANGAAVSRTTYAALFAALGTTFGVGDGSTTFNLPDLRGEFPRGWDDGRGADSGRAIGTAQNATRVYRHNYVPGFGLGGSVFDIDPSISADFDGSVETLSFSNTNRNAGTITGGVNSAVEGVRVRPRNIALLAIIKF